MPVKYLELKYSVTKGLLSTSPPFELRIVRLRGIHYTIYTCTTRHKGN